MVENRRIIWPSYLVALSLSVIPPIDALMQTMPMRFGEMRWRWGVFGLLSNAMMIPMIGLLVAFVVATVFEHRVFKRVLAAIAGVVGVGTLVGLGMFALDSLQLHKDVAPKMALAFNVACATGGLKALVGMMTLFGFAWAGFGGQKRKAQPVTRGVVAVGPRKSALAAAGAPASVSSASSVQPE